MQALCVPVYPAYETTHNRPISSSIHNAVAYIISGIDRGGARECRKGETETRMRPNASLIQQRVVVREKAKTSPASNFVTELPAELLAECHSSVLRYCTTRRAVANQM